METAKINLYQRDVELINCYESVIPTIYMYEKTHSYQVGNISPQWVVDELMYTHNYVVRYGNTSREVNGTIEEGYYFHLIEEQKIYKDETWDDLFISFYHVIMSYDDDIRYKKVLRTYGGDFSLSQGNASEYLSERLEQYKDIEFYFDEPIFGDGEIYLKTKGFPNTIEGQMMFNIYFSLFDKECEKICSNTFYTQEDCIIDEEYNDSECTYYRKKSGDYSIRLEFESEVDKQKVKAYLLKNLDVLLGRRFND